MSDDLRATIKAAMAEHTGDEADAPAAGLGAAAASEAPGGEAAPGGEGAAEAAAETAANAGQERDDKGKFAKPQKGEHNQGSEAASAADATPPLDEGTSRIPPGLPAPLKAAWKDLPSEWRKEYLRQDESFKVVRDAWAPKAERLNRIDAVLEPRREKLKLNGVGEDQWIERLAAAEDLLERNPAEGIAYLVRAYNADPRVVVARLTGSQAAQGPQLPPELQHLFGEVATLKQHVTQQRESATAAANAAVQDHIRQFASDPANLYFENVKDDVAAMLSSGRATDLKAAYDMACWANPEVRALLLKEQEAKSAKLAEAAQARTKAANAQRAAGSITGAPGAGATPAGGADPTNLRETIRAAIHSSSGDV